MKRAKTHKRRALIWHIGPAHASPAVLLAFVLSASLAGLAGATKTVVLGFETLTDVHWTMSDLVVLMTLVGGMGTLAGPVVGAWLAERLGIAWFATLGESVGMVTGLIFILCVLLFRRGIVGEIGALLERGRHRPERT